MNRTFWVWTSAVLFMFLSLSIISGKAQAAQIDMYCNGLAQFAEAVAKDRDNGASLEGVVKVIRQSPNGTSDHIAAAVQVFAEPHLAPHEEAGVLFITCVNHYNTHEARFDL